MKSTPKHQAITSQLATEILAGKYGRTGRLPREVQLVKRFGVAGPTIGQALQSVSGWVSEIIVVLNEEVDDGTEEIACRHGAKVFREPWKGFRDQKNSAARKAGQDWILNLDADEVVPVRSILILDALS